VAPGKLQKNKDDGGMAIKEPLKRIKIVRKIWDRLKDFFYLFTHAHLARSLVDEEESRLIDQTKGADQILYIAFRPTGGFGDYIISARFLDELMSYAPCRVDVYCTSVVLGQCVYGSRPGVTVHYWDSLIYNTLEGVFCPRPHRYDLTITAEHFVRVHTTNQHRLTRLAPALMDAIATLQREFYNYYPNAGERNASEALHFHRCEMLGIDRYSTLRHRNIFSFSDKSTYISFDETFANCKFEFGLEGKAYVTVNYGAGNMGKMGLQTKVWPKKHFETLISMLKEHNPDLLVVQLGAKENSRLLGADCYIMGESMEIAKWILRDSQLHIDSEGGLVHLATQVSTKCVVMFGPTPAHYYGYEQNCNIVSTACSNCMGRTRGWAYECIHGGAEPICMHSIQPKMVFDVVKRELAHTKEPVWKIYENSCEKEYSAVLQKDFNANRKLIDELFPRRTTQMDPCYIAVVGKELVELAEYLAKRGYQVAAFDPNFDDSDVCTISRLMRKRIDARFGSAWNIPYPAERNDYVLTAMECGSERMQAALDQEIFRILKTGGKCVSASLVKEKL